MNLGDLLYLIPVIIILIVAIGVGFWSGRLIKGVESFYTMNREANIVLLIGTYVASWIAGTTLLGAPGMMYKSGLGFGLLCYGFWGVLIFVFAMGLPMRRFVIATGSQTVPDFFGFRFQSKTVRAIVSLIIIVGLGTYIVGQLAAVGVVFVVANIPYTLGIIVVMATLVYMVVAGGTRSVVVNDTLNLATMILAVAIFTPFIIGQVGGLHELTTKIAAMRENAWAWYGAGPASAMIAMSLSYHLIWNMAIPSSPHLVQRAYIVKEDRTFVSGILFANFIVFALVAIYYLGAVSAIPLFPEGLKDPDFVIPQMARHIMNPFLGGIIVAGVLASAYSTANTQLSNVAFAVGRDIYQEILHPDASEDKVVSLTRWAAIIVGIITTVLALLKPAAILVMVSLSAGFYGAAFLPLFVYSIWWKRTSREAAIWSLVITAVVYGGLAALQMIGAYPLPAGIHPVVPATILNVILIPVISLSTKQSPEELEAIRTMDEAYRQYAPPPATGRQYLGPIALIVMAIAFGIIYTLMLRA